MADYNDTISSFTGEKVKLYRVKCKCGHTINFIRNYYVICNHCGRKVYATKKNEFKDKLLKEINKK
jgi:hypothetical protein